MSPMRLTPMQPAMETQTPSIMNARNFMPTALMPLRRADFSLMPTACVYRPRLVKRSTNDTTIANAITIKIGVGIGIPGMKLPM